MRGNSPVNTTIFNLLGFSNILDSDHFKEGRKRKHLPALVIDLKSLGKQAEASAELPFKFERKHILLAPQSHLCCFSVGTSKQDRCSQYPGSSWSLSTRKALRGGGWKGKSGRRGGSHLAIKRIFLSCWNVMVKSVKMALGQGGQTCFEM